MILQINPGDSLGPTPSLVLQAKPAIVVFENAAECQELWARHVVVAVEDDCFLMLCLKFSKNLCAQK